MFRFEEALNIVKPVLSGHSSEDRKLVSRPIFA